MKGTVSVDSKQPSISLEGAWDPETVAALHKQLSVLAEDPRPLQIDLSRADGLPVQAVQLLLCFVRHARSVPKPVSIVVADDQGPALRRFGLDQSGWEGFFHVH